MEKKKLDVRRMALLAMFCGLLLVMGISGIGLIPLPVIKATTMHIPVILGAIILGPKAGALLGGVFGLFSIWSNTTTPGLISFAFSPFLSMDGAPGAIKAIWVALGCRILLGLVAGWLWTLIRKIKVPELVALPVVATVATVFHSFIVMGSIYLLFAQQYAAAKAVAVEAVFGLTMAVIASSGIPEAIAAAVLVTVIGKAILAFMARNQRR